MSGYRADYIPGWDCHGLPIEHQIEKETKEKKIALSKIETSQQVQGICGNITSISSVRKI